MGVFVSCLGYRTASDFVGLSKSMRSSLYVGTMTNVPDVANSHTYPHIVFLQVFSTLGLMVLSIAGYIVEIQSEPK